VSADARDPRLEDLDDLNLQLSRELDQLLVAGEQVLAEMDAIDELRTTMGRNGCRLVAARRARREAMRARTDAGERRQQASAAYQRAREVGRDLDAVVLRARALLSLPRPQATTVGRRAVPAASSDHGDAADRA
jgi:hypothetical protein